MRPATALRGAAEPLDFRFGADERETSEEEGGHFKGVHRFKEKARSFENICRYPGARRRVTKCRGDRGLGRAQLRLSLAHLFPSLQLQVRQP